MKDRIDITSKVDFYGINKNNIHDQNKTVENRNNMKNITS